MVGVQKRKVRWAISLFLVMLYFSGLPTQAQYSGGTGEPNDPYQIATAEDLMLLCDSPEDYDKHFILTADIDLDPNLPGRKVFDKAVIAPDINPQVGYDGSRFTGIFDGNGHRISHLTITGVSNLGLFGRLDYGAEVRNLGIVEANIAGSGDNVGGLVGYNSGGSITTSYSTGTVTGNERVSGLVGYNSKGSITTSYSTCTVTGDKQVGGLVGYNSKGSITTSYSTGTTTGNEHVGGLVGYNNEGSITTSYSTGTTTGNEHVGGLVGNNSGSIAISYSTGTVSGERFVGGLVGLNSWGSITSITTSYSTGTVSGTGDSVGGLVGYNSWGSIAMSYSTGTVSGHSNVGGLVGRSSGGSVFNCFWDIQTSGLTESDGGTRKTTAEMQTASTFLNASWDFVDEVLNGTCDYWQISPGDYPRLLYHIDDSPVMPEGLGTAQEPYLIRVARDLGTVWFEPMAHYRLETSVDLSGITWSMAVIPWFEGTFDGNDHVINNLHIQGWSYVGLFGQLGRGAKVSNLGLEAVEVNGTGNNVGGLVGVNSGGSITTSYSTGTVSGGNDVGGLVGYNSGGNIATSYSTGTVTGNEYSVGGLVGWNYSIITTSYSTCTVTGDKQVGGLAGVNWGDVTQCCSTGTVTGNERVGGLVGYNKTSLLYKFKGGIAMSYSTGTVSGESFVGGLVGINDGSIAMSYSTGMVSGTGDYVGGLVVQSIIGHFSIVSTTTSFWDMETSGQLGSAGGTGKTTAEMQTASTFLEAGWDFVDETENGTEDIWSICEGTNYPRFVWQIPAGDFVCPDGITIDDFVFFIEHWRDDNCDLSNDYCDGTDLDFSGTVDEADLEILVENWLAGVRSD